jgi:hypothetical protein
MLVQRYPIYHVAVPRRGFGSCDGGFSNAVMIGSKSCTCCSPPKGIWVVRQLLDRAIIRPREILLQSPEGDLGRATQELRALHAGRKNRVAVPRRGFGSCDGNLLPRELVAIIYVLFTLQSPEGDLGRATLAARPVPATVIDVAPGVAVPRRGFGSCDGCALCVMRNATRYVEVAVPRRGFGSCDSARAACWACTWRRTCSALQSPEGDLGRATATACPATRSRWFTLQSPEGDLGRAT